MGQADLNAPNLIPEPGQNQPQSLLGGFMGGMSNMASNMMNSMNSHFNGEHFPHLPMNVTGVEEIIDQDSDMTIETNQNSGRIFLEKFREKNGNNIELPPFVEGTFDEIVDEAKRLQRPIFLYVHNHKGDSWTIVDQTVIGEEIVKDLVSKFICVGVNVNSEQGKQLLEQYPQGSRQSINIPGAPFVGILYVNSSGCIDNIGSGFSDEINVTSIFEMTDTANSMMSNIFGVGNEVTPFNPADSNLSKVETEEVKAEIENQLQNQSTTGFVESRSRGPRIDPNTGMAFGMTEKQIEDKKIKDKQQEELNAAMEADRTMLEERKQQKEEEKEKYREEVKRSDAIIRKQNEFKELAKVIKENLSEEPSEDNPDVCTVQFRLPDGSQNIQRRFFKSDKIKELYDYIHSLRTEEEHENLTNDFVILQNFPQKIFDEMNNTLETEGLFPRCKLYIKDEGSVTSSGDANSKSLTK